MKVKLGFNKSTINPPGVFFFCFFAKCKGVCVTKAFGLLSPFQRSFAFYKMQILKPVLS